MSVAHIAPIKGGKYGKSQKSSWNFAHSYHGCEHSSYIGHCYRHRIHGCRTTHTKCISKCSNGDGTHSIQCEHCTDTKIEEHVYENDTCVCGAKKYIKGDVNNDGIVDDADVEYLLYYTIFPGRLTNPLILTVMEPKMTLMPSICSITPSSPKIIR